MTAKLRLDELLLAGGFYPTLEAAYRACLAGSVMVDGATVTQPGTPVIAALSRNPNICHSPT
ncbi:hypothetical protein FACS1894104_5610 [Actinomycetota bacterium]|nr:hypothetical protein FACS1894104_5610 [Actinomycetota bacterium]